MTEKIFHIFTDGASSGNPGPSGIGVVIKEGDAVIAEVSESIGSATNNIAEYKAVIAALKEAVARRAEKVILHTDSELVFHQLTGGYKVKNENLQALFEQVRQTAQGLKRLELKCIPREQNSDADRLARRGVLTRQDVGQGGDAKKGIKSEQAKVVAFPLNGGREESPGSKG